LDEGPDRVARALARLYLILCVVFLAAMVIHLIPEHRRQMARLRLLRLCGLVTSQLARRTGVASMGRELATGEQAYGLPYRLSLWRLAFDRAYEQSRSVGP
jgi:hypothetical protein